MDETEEGDCAKGHHPHLDGDGQLRQRRRTPRQTITIDDTLAPILTCESGPITVQRLRADDARWSNTQSSDNCDDDVTVVQMPARGHAADVVVSKWSP